MRLPGNLPRVGRIKVCCAIIESDGKVLAARRAANQSLAGKWEFPGGKVEPHEDPREALIREIHEELGCEIAVEHAMPAIFHDYVEFAIHLLPYQCRLISGEPIALEHESVDWYPIAELSALDWAEADLPVLAHFMAKARELSNQD